MTDFKGSPLHVFSVLQNCRKQIEKYADIQDVYTIVSSRWLENSGSFMKSKCKILFNEIENGFYSYKDLTNAIYCLYYNNKTIKYNLINNKNINIIKQSLSNKEFIKSKKILLEIDKQLKFKHIKKYFEINEGGESYIYALIKKKIISPVLFVMFFDNFKIESNVGISEDYLRFIRITKKLKENMTNDK